MNELFILMIGGLIAFIVILLVLFSLKGRLGTYPIPPANLLPVIQWNIGTRGFPCYEAKPGVLSVQKDALVKVKIHFRHQDGGSKVLYEIDATEIGWVMVLVFVFLPYVSLVGLIIALYIHFSGRAFSRDFIGNLVRSLASAWTGGRVPQKR